MAVKEGSGCPVEGLPWMLLWFLLEWSGEVEIKVEEVQVSK